jgi:WD40-like Beta Propeller Repeat
MNNTKLLLVLAVASVILLATACSAQYRSDSCGCPPPLGDSGGLDGRYFPPFADLAENLSPDEKWLAFVGNSGQCLLNFNTLERKEIFINGGFPNAEIDASGGAVWCPYDPDLMALMVAYNIDTANAGITTVRVQNIFTYRISTGQATRITPTILGKYGPPGMSKFLAWLPSSTPGKDSFMIGYSQVDAPDHRAFFGIYSPQTQALIPEDISYTDTLAWSRDLKHRVWFIRDTIQGTPNEGVPLLPFYLDSIPLNFPKELDTSQSGIHMASFSPDGKHVAFWVSPLGEGPPDSIFDQVWVCNVSDSRIPECVINFQCLYCRYSFWGIYPVFLTDSTLAVSMHHDGDSISPLWEITTCGQIVRQLTYLPQSGVAPASSEAGPAATASPDPAGESTLLSFTTSSAGNVRVEVFDVLGNKVTGGFSGTLSAGNHSVPVSLLYLPAGIYYARIVTAYGEVQTVKLVKK